MPGIAWKRFVPFVVYSVLAVVSVAAAASTETRSAASVAALVAVGVASWGLIEYGLHRVVFHYDATSERGKRFVYRSHLSHHEDPKSLDEIFASLTTSLPLATAYVLVALGVTRSWHATVYLLLGLIVGYFTYEWMHYQAHHRSPRLRVLRYLKKYHMLHHHQSSDLRFGVTTPFVDLLFGTFGRVGKARGTK